MFRNNHNSSFLRSLWLVCSFPLLLSCNNNQSIGEIAKNACGSAETYETIKKIVFDNAISSAVDDAILINDWSKSVSLTIENPLVSKVDREISRTYCSGRIILTIPENERPKFGGEMQLKADVTFFVQPSADGTGNVVSIDGVAPVVSKIIQANAGAIGMAEANRIENQRIQASAKAEAIAAAGGPQLQATFNPSFNCTTRLKNVERMICQDEGLAGLDRNLSFTFRNKIQNFDGEWKQSVLAQQRRHLTFRANCPNISCLYDWYNDNQNWVDGL